jgi:heat shock protein HslJ
MTIRMVWASVLFFWTTAWGADQKEIAVKLTVPDSAWAISIDGVYEVGNELWIISEVSQNPDALGSQVISTVRASIELAAPDLPVKYFIIGKTWSWENEEPYTFIENLKQVEKDLKSGRILYKKAEAPAGHAAGDSSGSAVHDMDPGSVLNRNWEWVATVAPAEKITVPNPERYTIRLTDDGKVQARFDCNRGGGEYEISAGKLSFGPMMSTRMFCSQDSLDGPYTRDLERVVSFFIEEGDLFLKLPNGGGTMRFRQAP